MSKKTRKRWKYDEIVNYLTDNTEVILLSTEYKRIDIELEFKCQCGNEFKSSWSNFLNRKEKCCLECQKTIQNLKMYERIETFVSENSDSVLVSEKYFDAKSKLKFKCKCGEEFFTSWSSFFHASKRQCHLCSKASNASPTSKISLSCSVCESTFNVHRFMGGDLFCNRHYQQMRNHGKILEYTRQDRNTYKESSEDENIIIVDIYNSLGDIKDTFIVDRVLWFGCLDQYKWTKENKTSKTQGYVIGNVNGKNTPIHRLIMKAKKGEIVDHINGNGLDNRKGNLRIVNHFQSQMNRGLQSNNKSGHRGVAYRGDINRWTASIGFKNKKIFLGSFIEKEDAIKARKRAEDKYFGEYNRSWELL